MEEKKQEINALDADLAARLSEDELETVKKASKRKAGRPAANFPLILKSAALALKKIGLTHKEIALHLNLREDKIQSILFATQAIDHKQLDEVKLQFAGQLGGVVSNLLQRSSDPDFIKELQGKEVVNAINTLIPTINLLTGKPTVITEQQNKVAEIEAKLLEIKRIEEALSKAIPKQPQSN